MLEAELLCFALGPCLERGVDSRRYWYQIATFSSRIAERILLGADTERLLYGEVTVWTVFSRMC